MTMKKPFSFRAFAALLMTFSGVGLPITGLANHYLAFDPMSVERHAWMTAHNVLAILFTVSAIWHIVQNRQAWARHLKGPAGRMPTISREAMYAFGLVFVVTCLMVSHAFFIGNERHGQQSEATQTQLH
jgi:hypothetical protein